MRLYELGHLVHGGLPVDGQVALAQLLGDPRPGHVHPEEPAGRAVGVLLGDQLHHPVGVADDHGPADAGPSVLRHDDVEPGVLGRRLRQPGVGDLRVAVDAHGHPVVIDGYRVLAQDVLDGDDGLGVADVGQARRVDDVADRPHGIGAGAAALVDDHEAAIDLDADALEPETVG